MGAAEAHPRIARRIIFVLLGASALVRGVVGQSNWPFRGSKPRLGGSLFAVVCALQGRKWSHSYAKAAPFDVATLVVSGRHTHKDKTFGNCLRSP